VNCCASGQVPAPPDGRPRHQTRIAVATSTRSPRLGKAVRTDGQQPAAVGNGGSKDDSSVTRRGNRGDRGR
jgi:hypothetical protein